MRTLIQTGWAILALAFVGVAGSSRAETTAVAPGPGGKLVYATDERGNRIPDFSNCGYAGADRDIPDVSVAVRVAPGEGDDGARIQAAIDEVSRLRLREDGTRGAVELAPGEFQVGGALIINESGVVLRGSGAGPGGTTIVATGPSRRTVIRIPPTKGMIGLSFKETKVIDDYVPVGGRLLRLDSASELRMGDRVIVERPSTKEWISALGMNAFGVGWRPGSRNIRWDRIVVAVDGNMITLDAPITTAIDKQFGGATVSKVTKPGLAENIGIEDLALISQVTSNVPLDEEHAWYGVTMEDVEDAWVRRVEFRGFAGGAVALWESTMRVTVEDCISLAPISEVGGFRRHAFFTQGQLTLFLRCWSEQGRHDFAVGHCAAGPNAFVNCRTRESLADSGPLESWASGVLYDNVRIDGNDLNLINRWADPPGTGWSAANCVLWQCRAATIACFRPPTANNWAIGGWAQFAGDGTFESRSDFVRPLSLYQGQLRERVGDEAASRVDPILGEPIGATNPTLEEAAKFAAESLKPARELVDDIRERLQQHTKSSADATPDSGPPPSALRTWPNSQPLKLQNGWLIAGDHLATGRRFDPLWWRGNVRADDVQQFGQNISRFVPGRVGTGFTDDLAQVADDMVERGEVAYDHHYGLWYERRRDDHTMGRQVDGDVAAPFYEQPFARTGDTAKHGTAWDGLSKYDLTQFNLWYWNRLRDFAKLAGDRGLVLMHENYFQHNILEAGAHWADSPWRPSNNINDTGLPEPPPYIGDKRQFIAPTFYDATNPKLRALHRGYIRQSLDNFADTPNVIQMTSAEYSGPLDFTQFWLDTIIEWEKETGRDAIVALSAPKDVQDAILADFERAKHVDVIDIRYWAYTANDELYAPKGGQNLAPRQHLRQTRQKPGGAAAIVKAVREYRDRFPDKAILYNAEENCPSAHDGWATLIAGGSLADVKLPAKLASLIPTMRPTDAIISGDNKWCLADGRGEYLIYTTDLKNDLELNLPDGHYRAAWINAGTGKIQSAVTFSSDQLKKLPAASSVIWISRQN